MVWRRGRGSAGGVCRTVYLHGSAFGVPMPPARRGHATRAVGTWHPCGGDTPPFAGAVWRVTAGGTRPTVDPCHPGSGGMPAGRRVTHKG
jgi:hypothetical protein